MAEATKHTITVDLDMFDKTPEEKTAHANEIAREFGVGEDALAAVEDFKKELTKHNAWDLPFMGYVNEDGYGYAYVPNAAITTTPYWDAHAAFLALPKDAQTAFAIRCCSHTAPSTAMAQTCSCTTSAASARTSSARERISTDRRSAMRTHQPRDCGTSKIVQRLSSRRSSFQFGNTRLMRS